MYPQVNEIKYFKLIEGMAIVSNSFSKPPNSTLYRVIFRWSLCDQRQARENMQRVPGTRKHSACTKHGKPCIECKARENMQRLPGTRKHSTCTKRGKPCIECKARENMQRVPGTRKHSTCTKRGKLASSAKREKTCKRY